MAARKSKKSRTSILGKIIGLIGALWRLLAKALGSSIRFVFRRAAELDEAHQRDGFAFLLLILGLIASAGAWFSLNNFIGHAIYAGVYGVAGRLGIFVPVIFLFCDSSLSRTR
jgi:S-DNA-T family DNA segregation ATPase FtsK/SpoIIIE